MEKEGGKLPVGTNKRDPSGDQLSLLKNLISINQMVDQVLHVKFSKHVFCRRFLIRFQVSYKREKNWKNVLIGLKHANQECCIVYK